MMHIDENKFFFYGQLDDEELLDQAFPEDDYPGSIFDEDDIIFGNPFRDIKEDDGTGDWSYAERFRRLCDQDREYND